MLLWVSTTGGGGRRGQAWQCRYKGRFSHHCIKVKYTQHCSEQMDFCIFYTVRGHLNSVNIKTTLFFIITNLWLFFWYQYWHNNTDRQPWKHACVAKKKERERYKIQYNIEGNKQSDTGEITWTLGQSIFFFFNQALFELLHGKELVNLPLKSNHKQIKHNPKAQFKKKRKKGKQWHHHIVNCLLTVSLKRLLRQFVKEEPVDWESSWSTDVWHQPHVCLWTRLRLSPDQSAGPRSLFLAALGAVGGGVGGYTGRNLLIRLPLGLLWVARAALGFTQWADGGVAVNLLVTGQASLQRER